VLSSLDKIIENFNESMSNLGAIPSVVIGTRSTRISRGGKNTIRIKDRRQIKYRKFTREDLIRASKKYVTNDEYSK
jgi:hypothetical protein